MLRCSEKPVGSTEEYVILWVQGCEASVSDESLSPTGFGTVSGQSIVSREVLISHDVYFI